MPRERKLGRAQPRTFVVKNKLVPFRGRESMEVSVDKKPHGTKNSMLRASPRPTPPRSSCRPPLGRSLMYSRDPQWRIALPMHRAMEHRGNDALTRDQRAACSSGGRFRTTHACSGRVWRARSTRRDLRTKRSGDVRELWQREHFVDGLVIQHALEALDAIGRMAQIRRQFVLRRRKDVSARVIRGTSTRALAWNQG